MATSVTRTTAAELQTLTGAQRAAILVMYLDEHTVRDIFSRLNEDEIRRVGEAISTMKRVDPELIQGVIAEFAGDLGRSLYLQAEGSDYLRRVFPAVLGPERAQKMLRSIEPVSRAGFQQLLGRIQPGALAARLRKEHPQTIAVACTVLGSQVAAQLLPGFDIDLQIEVATRMARLKQIPLELLQDIEDLLGQIDMETPTRHQLDGEGPKVVADALNALGGTVKDAILNGLAARDEALAAEVSRQLYNFDMLETADNRGIQNLLKEVERKDLATGLKGASPKVREKFFSNMSERAAQYLKDDMEAMGPVRLSDVETVQQQIVALALRLEQEGKLMFIGGTGDKVVE